MNTMTDLAGTQGLLESLLAPIAADAPCGDGARFDPVFTEIRLLREEDDSSLPMRQWERPLKQADWPAIEARCVDVLTTRSKHLQIAVWLAEAWMRMRGYAGLAQGLRLLEGLLLRYWTGLHPAIEADGDCDLRLAPLEWMNESLAQAARVHAPLLVLAESPAGCVTLADWDSLTAAELSGEAPQPGRDGAPVTRAGVVARADRNGIATTRRALADSLAALHAMHALLGERLGADAPDLGRMVATLDAALRVLAQRDPHDVMPREADAPVLAEEPAAAQEAPSIDTPPVVATVAWRSRAEAYATLEAVAAYLMEVEPHSPVPFLIRRALHWGRMPLPELIAEILREEGDLNRLVGVLGLKL